MTGWQRMLLSVITFDVPDNDEKDWIKNDLSRRGICNSTCNNSILCINSENIK